MATVALARQQQLHYLDSLTPVALCLRAEESTASHCKMSTEQKCGLLLHGSVLILLCSVAVLQMGSGWGCFHSIQIILVTSEHLLHHHVVIVIYCTKFQA